MLRTHLLARPLSRSNRRPAVHNTIYGVEAKGLEAQLFDLVSLLILTGVRVTVAGGGETTIGALMRKVWANRPYARYKRTLASANVDTNVPPAPRRIFYWLCSIQGENTERNHEKNGVESPPELISYQDR